MPNSFDMEDTRRRLIALREFFGADTPEGHTLSNIIELRQNYEKADGQLKIDIGVLMGKQCQRLERLKAEREARSSDPQ